jgi:hypothetical protein
MTDRPGIPPLLIALPLVAMVAIGGAMIVLGQDRCAASTTLFWGVTLATIAGLTVVGSIARSMYCHRWKWTIAMTAPVLVTATLTSLLIWPWMRARCDAWIGAEANSVHLRIAAGESIESALGDDATCGPCYWINEASIAPGEHLGWRTQGRWLIATEPLPAEGSKIAAVIILQPTRVDGELRPQPTLVVMGNGELQWVPMDAETGILEVMSTQREAMGLSPIPRSMIAPQ